MDDLLYMIAAGVFFLVTAGLVALCERLSGTGTEAKR